MPLRPLAPALAAGLLWLVVAASATCWVLHFPRETSAVRPAVTPASSDTAEVDAAPVARALGQVQPQTVAAADASRFQLLGVVSLSSGGGSALLAVDGQPPKAWRVGQAVQEGVYLQKLAPRQAWLGTSPTGPAQWTLQMAGPERP